MNMNKALQNLYYAVSGSTTTKVNISKLLVDIHYAITGKESENKNNWSRIINSMADNWPEGGGGGSSDFSTATVTVVNTTQHNIDIQVLPLIVESGIAPGVIGASLDQLMAQESVPLTVPLYKGACYWATSLYEPYADYTFTGLGSVTEFDGIFLITGDCTITIS